MDLVHAKMLRLFFAGTIFWMVLVLTPRVWVEHSPLSAESEQVPVRLLDSGDDCIWCDTYPSIEPVRCDDEPADKPMWLNPDDALDAQPWAPCLDEKDTERPTA